MAISSNIQPLMITARDSNKGLYKAELGNSRLIFDKKWLLANYDKLNPANFKVSQTGKVIIRGGVAEQNIDPTHLLYRYTYYIMDESIKQEKDELKIAAKKLSMLGIDYRLNFSVISYEIERSAVILESCILPGVTKLKLPSYIEFVNNDAFSYNNDIAVLDLNQVQSIQDRAFAGCEGLQYVRGDMVTWAGKNAFAGCSSLQEVYLDRLREISEDCFASDVKLKVMHAKDAKTIGKGAFYNCKSLTKLNLPNVRMIGDEAFLAATNIEELNLNSAQNLFRGTFAGIKKLRKLDMDSLNYIDTGMLAFLDYITVLKLPAVTAIFRLGIKDNIRLKRVILPSCSTLTDQAICNCPSLEYIQLGDVKELVQNTFCKCWSLKEVRVKSVGRVEEGIFNQCPNAKLVIKNT